MSRKTKPIEFFNDFNGCMICTSHSGDTHGYPQIRTGDKKRTRVVRYLWKQKNGEIPTGMHILHSCDNPACINLNHIRLGTHLENMRDMINKGRAKHVSTKGHRGAIGERNAGAKLSSEKIKEIRTKYADNRTKSYKNIAIEYGVHLTTIYNILKMLRWENL